MLKKEKFPFTYIFKSVKFYVINSHYTLFILVMLQDTHTNPPQDLKLLLVASFGIYVIQSRRQKYNGPQLGSQVKFLKSSVFATENLTHTFILIMF